jgi:hypothetical protein
MVVVPVVLPPSAEPGTPLGVLVAAQLDYGWTTTRALRIGGRIANIDKYE